jgi:hypothetical protein
MQHYIIRLFLQNALHVSGGSSAHHQEFKNCAYSIGYLSSRPSSTTLAAGSSNGLTNTRCFMTVFELLMMGGGTA